MVFSCCRNNPDIRRGDRNKQVHLEQTVILDDDCCIPYLAYRRICSSIAKRGEVACSPLFRGVHVGDRCGQHLRYGSIQEVNEHAVLVSKAK